MLSNLIIKNFAIIKNTSLDFSSGFNVLIGETGAGKSIIIDALNFVLGAKANKENIRSGEQQMIVKATFENLSPETKSALDNFLISFEEDDVLIISRSFSIDGKSICNINGETVTLTMLKQLAETLLDSCGQHDSVQLLKNSNHLKILDKNCPNEVEDIKSNISMLLGEISNINKQIDKLGGSEESRERLIDLLSYQIKEIESANISEGEEEQLRSQIQIANNTEILNSNLSSVFNCINASNLSSCVSYMQTLAKIDNQLEDLYQRLSGAVIELEDISASLNDYKEHIEFDEKEVDVLNLRLDTIKNIKKKYGSSYSEIMNFYEKSKDELYNLQNCEQKIIDLNKKKQACVSDLYTLSLRLHDIREKVAGDIEGKVQKELSFLGMKKAVFKISFDSLPQDINNATFTHNGLDNIEFLFSANVV